MAKFSDKKMGKEVGSAAVYATPHTMSAKKITGEEAMKKGVYVNEKTVKTAELKDPIPNGVSYANTKEPKTTGIKMRGTGCATKGTMSRGPMA
jgi:hypothetical protein